MFTKLIFTIEGEEIVFEAHEMVEIAQQITKNTPDKKAFIPLEGYYAQFIEKQTTGSGRGDDYILNGGIDKFITIPLHIGGLSAISQWLYVARHLRQDNGYAPRYGWWMNAGGRLLLIKNRYYGYQLDVMDYSINFNKNKKDWAKNKDLSKHFLIYKREEKWYVYGKDYTGKLLDMDITDPVIKDAPGLTSENFTVYEQELLDIVTGSVDGLGHRQDYYISDHGVVTDITRKTNEIVFGVDWINPVFVKYIIDAEKHISSLSEKELSQFKRKLTKSMAKAPIAEMKAFHPDKTESELVEIQRLCAEDPKYAEENWSEIRGINHYILQVLAKQYIAMRLETPGFDRKIFDDFGCEDGSKLLKRCVLFTLMGDVNKGSHSGLIRPLYSYGGQFKGDAYHDFERSVARYFSGEDAVTSAQLATEMRTILAGGLLFSDALSFLPNLTVAWFTAEAIRNELSIMTGLMLLDMLESEISLKDPGGFNWYTWQNALIHPLKSAGEKKWRDLYGKMDGIDRFGGAHPMAHGGSVSETSIPLHTCQLRLISGEVGESWDKEIKVGKLVVVCKEGDNNYWLHYTDDLKTHIWTKITDTILIQKLNKLKFSGEVYEKSDLRDPITKILKNEGSRLHFDPIRLPKARQKEGSLIIHWLFLKLSDNHPSIHVAAIPAYSPQGKLTEPHLYNEIADENNSSIKLRWAENKIKRTKSDIKRLRNENDIKKATEEEKKQVVFEAQRKRLKIKIDIQKKYIEPLLQARLSTLSNLLPCSTIKKPHFTKLRDEFILKDHYGEARVNDQYRASTKKNVSSVSESLRDFGMFSFSDNLDEIPEAVKIESKKLAEEQQLIGPREIFGWELKDVDDIGNCYYDAIVDQLQLLNHPFITEVPVGTLARDSLRLRLQGAEFQDREWAENELIDIFVKKFSLILAVVDTRSPESGFVCYYRGEDGDVITNTLASFPLPNLPIIRLAATGNHFLSVRSHPALMQGSINDSYNAFPLYHEPSTEFVHQLYKAHIIENRHNDHQIQKAYDERYGLIIRP